MPSQLPELVSDGSLKPGAESPTTTKWLVGVLMSTANPERVDSCCEQGREAGSVVSVKEQGLKQ